MKRVCKLYIIRHGESVANRDNLVGGHFDSPLTDKGRKQARETKQLLADVHFDTAYSSDLRRATETAAIIFGQTIPSSRQLYDLRERNFGRLEGGSTEEWFGINKAYEDKYAELPFEERWHHEYADDIENDKVLCQRVEKALKNIAQKHMGQTVLVVIHGGPIRTLLMKLKHAPFLTAGSFANAGYVELTYDGRAFRIAKVIGVNLAPPSVG
jgi:broad specificity phosphatase PhoE